MQGKKLEREINILSIIAWATNFGLHTAETVNATTNGQFNFHLIATIVSILLVSFHYVNLILPENKLNNKIASIAIFIAGVAFFILVFLRILKVI